MGKALVAKYFLSQHQGDFNDEAANPFQQDDNGRKLRKSRRMFVAPDFRLVKDAKILLGGRVSPFGSRTQSLEFLMAFGSSDYLSNQPWKLYDRHMLAESVIVNPVRAVVSELNDCFIF